MKAVRMHSWTSTIRFLLLIVVMAAAVACLEAGSSSGDADGDGGGDVEVCLAACARMADCYDAGDDDPRVAQCLALCSDQAGDLQAQICLAEADCRTFHLCLPQTEDGDESNPDGDGQPILDGDAEWPDSCQGACGEAVASFCIGDSLCVCLTGEWTLVLCADVCSRSGQRLEGCGYLPEAGYDQCLCVDETPDTCAGACDEEGAGFCESEATFCFCSERLWRPIDCAAWCDQAWSAPGGHCEADAEGSACACDSRAVR
ncbi:MAG: hypothetical protein C4523_21405 [Myxococcales bacterium]|nr:MAG: hypothetical protein C4523_21405 [Myxococcales bacterium]